ncbi:MULTISPECIES: hypothetical protein [unclassified Desulfovibrio]|uniref:hypothetical protein n=1 Tax=unclassified Desulfovibrio TaxID=2593640 RepID=UPI0013EC90E5|nr:MULTISPECIES: hypothetical protein [unclassified Desulfovibrio]
MAERYTIFKKDRAYENFRCLFPLPFPDESRNCVPWKCPAWIDELDENGEPTGRGRCGMVPARIELAPA